MSMFDAFDKIIWRGQEQLDETVNGDIRSNSRLNAYITKRRIELRTQLNNRTKKGWIPDPAKITASGNTPHMHCGEVIGITIREFQEGVTIVMRFDCVEGKWYSYSPKLI